MNKLDHVLQPGLLGQGGPALDVPLAVGDANDLAADGRGNRPGRPADAAAKVQNPHALLETGHLGIRLLVGRHTLADGETRCHGRVVELLPPGCLSAKGTA